LAAFVTFLGGVSFGYDMGIVSNVIAQIKDTFALTCMEQYVLSSTWFIGAIIASLVGGTSWLDLNLSCPN
jgi:SP family facilitated glucose transporter-like MFS transporter 10